MYVLVHLVISTSPILPLLAPPTTPPSPEKIWQEDNLHLCLSPYNCAATGTLSGMIEVVLGAETLAAVRETNSTSTDECCCRQCHMQWLVAHLQVSSDVMNEKALYEWLQAQHKG